MDLRAHLDGAPSWFVVTFPARLLHPGQIQLGMARGSKRTLLPGSWETPEVLQGPRRCPALPGMSQPAGSDGWELAPGKAVTAVEVQSPSLGAAALLQDINTLGQGLGKSYMLPGLFRTKTNSLIGGA